MMYSQNRAARYNTIRSQGQVADASPTRLVQIMFEHILTHLTVAQGCMERIKDNLPLPEVVTKGKAIGKAVRLIGQLDGTLDMEKGGQIAANLHNLYVYMLSRLTTANIINDPQIVGEIIDLMRKIKGGWDQIVKAGH
jgi:flagellar secretion chaperone FliS